jgi:hypothetical protein
MFGCYCLLWKLFQIDDGEIKKIRVKVIESKEAAFKQNENEVTKKWSFEEAVSCTVF